MLWHRGGDVPACHAEFVGPPLRRIDGDFAVVDADHGSGPGVHERGVVQAVAALKMDHLGRMGQDIPQQVALDVDERVTGRRLGQQIVVLAYMLL